MRRVKCILRTNTAHNSGFEQTLSISSWLLYICRVVIRDGHVKKFLHHCTHFMYILYVKLQINNSGPKRLYLEADKKR